MDAQLAFYSIVLNWSFNDNVDDNNPIKTNEEIKTNHESYHNHPQNSIFDETKSQQPPLKKRKLNNDKQPSTPPPPLEPAHSNNSPQSPLVMKIPKILNGKTQQNATLTDSHKTKKSRFKRAVGLKSKANKSQQSLDFNELFPVEKFKQITKFQGDPNSNKAEQLSKICTFPNILSYKEHFAALLFDDLRARLDNQISDALRCKWKKARDMLPAQLLQDIGHKEYICCSFQILTHSNDNWSYYVNTKMLVFITYNLPEKPSKTLPWTHLLAIIDEQPTASHIKLQIHLHPNDHRYASFVSCFNSEKRKKQPMKIVFLDNIQNRMREFRAICAADKLLLKNIIIDPKSVLLQEKLCAQKPQHIGSNSNDMFAWSYVPDAYKKRLGRYLNSSQCKAIEKACKSGGITLLQGPPGTGKTRTVLHLMNAYHIGKTQAMFESWLKTMYNKLHTHNNNNNSDVLPIAKPRILVAAPSNAAVDEIIVRLMSQQFVDGNDFKYSPPIIRIGNMDKCRIEVGKQVSLHSKVDAFLNHRYNNKFEQQVNLKKLADRIRFFKQKKLENESKLSQFITSHLTSYQEMSFETFQQNEAQKIIHFLQQIHSSYVELQRCLWVKTLSKKSAKDKLITSILLESEIIFTTLNSAGGRELRLLLTENEDNKHKLFDHCIIDEAGQCTEPDILIPLIYDIDSVVLVGDPQQLPATVFAQGPSAWLYERSLFERLMSAGYPTHLLDTQYRMHPEISFFPNLHFYGDKLKNGHNVLGPKYMFNFHSHVSALYKPFLFFNISASSMKYGAGGHSLYNRDEVAFITQHLESFYADNQYTEVNEMQIGVITPYKQQQKKIIDALQSKQYNLSSKNIEVATVDFYQGREKDIVFFSCVRAGGQNGIGFLSDIRRMNVAITRAKYSLWIVGNNISLQKNPDWNELIKHAKNRKCMKIIKYNKQMKRYYAVGNKRENKIVRIPRPTLLTDNNLNRHNQNGNNQNRHNQNRHHQKNNNQNMHNQNSNNQNGNNQNRHNRNHNHNNQHRHNQNSVSVPMIIDYGNMNHFNQHRNPHHHHHHQQPPPVPPQQLARIIMPHPQYMQPHIIIHPNHPRNVMQQLQIQQNDAMMIDYTRNQPNHANSSAFDD